MSDDLVVIARLDGFQGFYSMNDVLELVSQMNQKGMNAIVEMAPGALMETQAAYFIKVPVDQQQWAQEELAELLSK